MELTRNHFKFNRAYRALIQLLNTFKTSSMAPTTSGTWTAFYERNKDDGGAIQRLFRTNLSQFAVMTENHLDDVDRLMATVAGSNYGNMILVPGPTGFMQVIHHGFAHATEMGGTMDIIAVHGNLSEAALKVIPKKSLVMKTGNNTGRRSSIDCPTLTSMLESTTPDEFRTLEPERNAILKKKPNHIFIGPETFYLAKGAKMVRSGELAALIIDKFTIDADDDDQVAQAKLEEARTTELLLAILWASEQDLLTPVVLEEPIESDLLNGLHRAMKARLTARPAEEGKEEEEDDDESNPVERPRRGRGNGRGLLDSDEDESESEQLSLDGDEETSAGTARSKRKGAKSRSFREEFSLSASGIVDIMKQVEMARQNERKKDAQDKSLLRHLGPSQRELFLLLSTADMTIAPALTDFMAQLSRETTATKALQQVVSESKDWEGTFIHGGFHKFLSSGFVSQEQNRNNPGGFTLFMFHPRTVVMPGSASFDPARARLRDLFEAKVDEETIAHYSKQGLFAASNHHDMRVQLQTALEMLILLLGEGSLATKGLAHVLEPQNWSRMSPTYHDHFRQDKIFGAQFIYCLDRSLQQLFRKMERANDRGDIGADDLGKSAAKLLQKLDDGYVVTVKLPHVLQPAPVVPALAARASAPLAITDGTASSPGAPPKKKRKGPGTPGPAGEAGSQIVANSSPCAGWTLPDGKRYADFFQGRTQSTQNWPVVTDDRLGSRSPAPLCIRFQATSSCRRNCRLAHVSRASLEPAARRIADDKFVTAYATTAETSTALVVN